ncbi:SLC2A1, partial [Symbiodinium necroappetens]
DLGTSARLIVAAAGDGILCIVQGEVLREAGAAGDVLAAQFGLFLLAGVGGGFLPGLAFVAARRKFPTICRNAAIGYAAMAVHSAVLLMQAEGRAARSPPSFSAFFPEAIGTEMRFFLDGGGYLFDSRGASGPLRCFRGDSLPCQGPQCLYSTIDSPLSLAGPSQSLAVCETSLGASNSDSRSRKVLNFLQSLATADE